MPDAAAMTTDQLEALEQAQTQAKADAINARATWRTMNHREQGKVLTPLWLALNQVSARVQNGVFDRATTLLETRESEMDTRCESALEGWPRNSGPIARSEAVAMQTITSSYIDALDNVNSVLDTMISSLIDQQHRVIEAEAQEASALDRALMAAEKELAVPSENIAAMDADRIKSTGERIEDVDYALRSHERVHSELGTVRTQLSVCRTARAHVLNYWRLALKLEAELAKIAH